jgi:hypothetical protein
MEFSKIPIEENKHNEEESLKTIALNQLNEIILNLPTELRELIDQSFIHKRVPKEYLLSSILFAFSNTAGLAFSLKHRSYVNYANLYLAIIGSRGDVKSEAMKIATSLLTANDDSKYDEYQKQKLEQAELGAIDGDKKTIDRKQFFIQNATIEAAMFAHHKNPYSIGIFVDELSYLIDKMANSNNSEGMQWKTFLLQGNTNQHIDISRKTTDSYRLTKSYPTLLGSIQHQFIPAMFANGNLESGFIDRILFTTKLTSNEKLSRIDLPRQTINNYNLSMGNLLAYRKAIESEKKTLEIEFTKDADDRIHDYVQDLIKYQKGLPDKEREYNAKMQINIYKLTLLIHLISNSMISSFQSKLSIETVDLAVLINEFYFTNFKLVLGCKKSTINNKEFLKELINKAKKNNIDQKDIVKLTGHSKSHISKNWNIS